MSKYDVILFDLDGTVTDSKLGIAKSVQYSLSKYDIMVENLDDLEKFIGPPLLDSFQEFYLFDETKANEAVKHFREYFSKQGIFENAVYPKLPELLEELKKLNKTLIIATSKPTVFAKKILDHFNLSQYFSSIVGSNLDGTRTSKSEVINFVLSTLPNISKKNIVMVGDRKHDILGARQNGLDSIAVTYGYGTTEEFKKAEPTYYAESIDDLLELLK
ncbi:HAD family hydrolase [Clostridium ganghwense]|uniref:HAD family hydrolase n=1 Tax=Clostridium ganghwense TaxID=312089 RepID=A0ABT4CR49_9CLOT|nr:HAD family hydrolase [Clostridium ganghwense]MCY6371403.1 HAD family hydrolase [Clostridium ganghwense]